LTKAGREVRAIVWHAQNRLNKRWYKLSLCRIHYHYPVRARWVSEKLVMGHFTTVSRAMKFYGQAEVKWLKEKIRF